MNIKRFIARDTREALRLVKKEMGPEAVILRTRTIPPSGKGLERSAQRIEITAAVDYDAPLIMPENTNPAQDGLRQMAREIREIKEALLCADAGTTLKPEIFFNRDLLNRYKSLKFFGLKPEIISELMDAVHEDSPATKKASSRLLQESLSSVVSRINIDGRGSDNTRGRKIYSFIGPTGVGKTTTLAKLAALSVVKGGRKAALITLDTFRIAAAAQLQAYARIIGIPLEVVANSNDLQRAIKKHGDCDQIFIDTAGKSPNNNQDIVELRNLMGINEEIHPFLVLSATTQYQGLVNTEKRFSTLPFKSYIFTKLDETQDVSTMINFLISRKKPVTYLTTGQQVPEDIEFASKKKLASLILAGMRETATKPNQKRTRDGSSHRS